VGIDYLTIYGTQLLQPFSDHPFGLGSIFIIDPAYTLPLLLGLMSTLISRSAHRMGWNQIGLAISTLYLAWGVHAQQLVTEQVKQDLPKDRIDHLMVSAGPLNSILWRVVAVSPTHYYEAWVSLLDKEKHIHWNQHDRGAEIISQHANNPSAASMASFSHGIYRMRETPSGVYITDLRMGAEPSYFFNFNLGKPDASGKLDPQFAAIKEGDRPDIKVALPWVWSRIWDQQTPSPLAAQNHGLNK
jgi:inner membrane protein